MDKPTVQRDDKNPQGTTTLSGASTMISTPSEAHRPSLIWPFFWLALALGWMAPIVALLLMNFKGYIAGAGVACGIRNCNDNYWNALAFEVSKKLNRQDHNINGALQVVAKALEVWFILVAGGLIFDLTMWLARKREGLPMRYLVIPSEFSELTHFFSAAIWMAPRSNVNRASTQPRRHNAELWIFISATAIICLVCNVMGPATAVLLLPTLGWQKISVPGRQAVATIGASSIPTPSDIIPSCTASNLTDGLYSCVTETMGSLVGLLLDNQQSSWGVINVQGDLSYSYNLSSGLLLVPNRQTVDYMTNDLHMWMFTGATNYSEAVQNSQPDTLTPSLYEAMRNSQQVMLQRQGPGYLFSCDCALRMHPSSVIDLTGDKVVRCFDLIWFDGSIFINLPTFTFPNYTTNGGDLVSTICIRTGLGWAGHNINSQFYLENLTSPQPVDVRVYSSDKAIYLNSSTYMCSTNEISTESGTCDWEAFFADDPDPGLRSVSVNPLVTEYIYSDNSTSSWCVSFTFLRYPTYVLDTSPTSNPFSMVTLTDNGPLTKSDEPIFVHPDWILASWGVDKNGILPYEYSEVQYFEEDMAGTEVVFSDGHQTIMAQGLSLIPYTLAEVSTASNSISDQTPVLEVSALVYAWSYGIKSRTSQLGVVVAIAGCVIVLIRVVVLLTTRTVPRGTLSLIATALEQERPHIFRGLEERQVERVRFRMENRKNAEFEFVS